MSRIRWGWLAAALVPALFIFLVEMVLRHTTFRKIP